MTQTVCVFGRIPSLSLAELESLYGAEKLRPVGKSGAILDMDPSLVDFSRLGGTVKFCKLLNILDTTDWKEIENYLVKTVPEHAAGLPEGKMKLGLSTYGLKVPAKQINATALSLKKVVKNSGRSIRVVPNTEAALSSAQVLHNQLTSALGWELIFIKDSTQTVLAQNIAEQDIEAYGARDQNRPKRDARVGMLPPKLAQTMINLAIGNVSEEPVNGSCEPGSQPKKDKTMLDAFCGTGVILQEAALMGYDVYGTDIETRMIDYSKTNLDWLADNFSHPPFTYWVEVGDATAHDWLHGYDFAASEAYLGQPFSVEPSVDKLKDVMQTTNTIIKKFMQNLAKQTKPGFRICLAVPAWNTKHGLRHLPLIDQIEDLRYNRVSFKHVGNSGLVYYREDQFVARELLVLTRK